MGRVAAVVKCYSQWSDPQREGRAGVRSGRVPPQQQLGGSSKGAAQGCCGGDALDGYIGRKGQPQVGTITSERKSRWQPSQLAAKNLTVDGTEVQPVAELSVT
jgi:hypothetical protein